MSSVAVDKFVSRIGPLIELERETEVAQTQDALQKPNSAGGAASSRVLRNLRCSDVEGGLLGRSLVTLINNKGGGSISEPLPPHKFSSHDIVDLKSNKAAPADPALAHGVVFRVKDDELIIACEEQPEEGLDQPLRLEKLANEVTYNRLKETLSNLSGASSSPECGQLVDIAFGNSRPRLVSSPPHWKANNKSLDTSQVAAVDQALAALDVALIHGPPGTGKTTAVVEYILQEVQRGNKVLATAASNMAVDNLVERLVRGNPKLMVVRVGHPARLLPQVLDSCLEAHVLRSDNSALAKDCRREIKQANSRLMKLGRKDYAERRSLRSEIRALAKEERKRQQKAVDEVLSQAPVICATLTGVLGRQVDNLSFDVSVVDEAAQATEIATWAALLKAPKAVLAGDHLQLPPTIISEEAARKGLGETLFERLHRKFGEEASTMLTVQYRMHSDIMQWSSDEMYAGKLQAHESVAGHRLYDLKGVRGGNLEEMSPIVLLDTAGCEMDEDATEGADESKRNQGEAKVAIHHCVQLLKAGIRPQDVGIITPYSAQVALLKELRKPELAFLEIGTVDGFQGREKEAIVISMVRSNPEGNVGFLADNRRMNVAVTRARRHCAIICDTETVNHDPFLKRLTTYFEEHGTYMSAAELEDCPD